MVRELSVKIKTFGPLRRIIGQERIEQPIAIESTVNDVIKALAKKFGARLEDILIDRGTLSGNMIVMLNGRDIDQLEGAQTMVSSDDEITILPHVQGGHY